MTVLKQFVQAEIENFDEAMLKLFDDHLAEPSLIAAFNEELTRLMTKIELLKDESQAQRNY